MVVYDDKMCYETQFLNLNDYTTIQLDHTIIIQMLIKFCKAYLRVKFPFKINKSIDD
jgi:hypothetical protein